MKRLLLTLLLISQYQLTFSQNRISVEQSVCDPYSLDPYELKERLIKREVKDDSLVIVLGKREICCAEFIADYSVVNDTLKIEYKNSGDECYCTCFYELTFKINIEDHKFNHITFNGLQFQQTDKKISEYTTVVDTLENGNILWRKYEDEELVFEIEEQDSIKVYRQFYKGQLTQENKRKKKAGNTVYSQ